MNYVLMHKTIPVAGFDLDPQTGTIRKISELYAPEHLPVGTPVRKGAADRAFLNEWWTSRAIPSRVCGQEVGLNTRGREKPCIQKKSIAEHLKFTKKPNP